MAALMALHCFSAHRTSAMGLIWLPVALKTKLHETLMNELKL